MFRALPRPSSGAYNCISSFWFYRWSMAVAALLVMVWQVMICLHHLITCVWSVYITVRWFVVHPNYVNKLHRAVLIMSWNFPTGVNKRMLNPKLCALCNWHKGSCCVCDPDSYNRGKARKGFDRVTERDKCVFMVANGTDMGIVEN